MKYKVVGIKFAVERACIKENVVFWRGIKDELDEKVEIFLCPVSLSIRLL